MKITYTAPNRAHHYSYAKAFNSNGDLHAFVSGFSRFSPRAALPDLKHRLKRHDIFQNLYLGCLKISAPRLVSERVELLSHQYLDYSSFKWAKESDSFIFYRTEGLDSTYKLKKDKFEVKCVMEEVNSHIDNCMELMRQEFIRSKSGNHFEGVADYQRRLQTYEVADYILCPSEFVRRSFLERGFNDEKLIKINFGFNSSLNSQDHIIQKREDDEVLRILYVGQIHYRKGLRYAFEAFKRLKRAKKEFIIVGPKTGYSGLTSGDIDSKVKFVGVLKGDRLVQEYKNADVFILPSIEEGLALVLGEAMSFGIPIITTRNSGAEDIIQHGKEGFIVPICDSNSILNYLEMLSQDKDLRMKIGNNAYERFGSLKSWKDVAKQLVTRLSC